MSKKDSMAINAEYENRSSTYEKNNTYVKKLWDKKSDNPYKPILDNSYRIKNLTPSDEKKLIIHKVTKNDKDINKLTTELTELTTEKTKLDKDLKIIYSASRENEHKAKFAYKQVIEQRIAASQMTNNEEHGDKVSYHKKQMTLDDNNFKKIMNIFTDDELKQYM